MTGILGRTRDALRATGSAPDTAALISRVAAVRRFLAAADGQLPDHRLASAHTVVERAGDRLALSREHTVVALAGSTGSGKSSLFNALARLHLSPVGVRRPTTGVTHACVWGPPDGATGLLDWVGVLPRHRYLRESALDADDEVALRGLVLLDLPDFDSVDRAHRTEVDRLLGLVDLVVWVVDPQKYADSVVHDSYLRQFHRHRDVTVVVLNHADRLAPADVPRCLADLRRLLADDGLGEVPCLATSALQPEALVELRALLERTVAGRQALLQRLAGDLDGVVAGLTGLVGPPVTEDALDAGRARALADALAGAAGVPAVVDATEQAYRHRAGAVTGWPPAGWLRRLRPDPLRRLHLGRPESAGDPVPATSVPAPEPVQRSAVSLAVRAVAEQAGQPLPEPWASAVAAAARSRLADLPDALDRVVATLSPRLDPPVWWRMVGAVQWLAAAAALFGLVWLGFGVLLQMLGMPPLEYPTVGVLPMPTALLSGGLLGGFLLALVLRPVVRFAARRAGARAGRRLRAAISEEADEYVVAPVRDVLRRYAQARDALADARR